MAYLRNPHLGAHQLATHQLAAHQLAANQFCWTGQLVSFVAGRKSSRQSILLNVACVHYGDAALLASSTDAVHAVRLGKSVRRMMMGYLNPSDWVRVVGKCKVDVHSGDLTWKAQEIIKLSAAQVKNLEPFDIKAQCLPEGGGEKSVATGQPVRVLICQQSSCRQRGSVAVSRVIDDALKASAGCSQVSVQAVGCLKNCKLGPNVMLSPKGKLQRQGLKTRYENVTSGAAKEIVEGIETVLGV